MSDLDELRELIELAAASPPPEGIGVARRILRRITVRLGRARARHQYDVDLGFLAAIGALRSGLQELHEQRETAGSRLNELERWRNNAQTGHEELRTWLANTDGRAGGLERTAAEHHEEIRELRERASQLSARSDVLEASIWPLPDPEALQLERFDAGSAGRVIGYRHSPRPVPPNEDYVAFEDIFRFSEETIRERQRPYLEIVAGREPVLDAGAGRGEFLEVLRDAGLHGYGVDLDAGMVERARAKGLNVEQGDLVAYLEGLEDDSLGAVFAAQVVEHLPYPQLVAFLRLAHHKLRPGGLLIAETVNPHAPTALKNIWFDLTHQHPIFPEVLLTLCRGIGFDSAYVFHPGASGNAEVDRRWFGDYAIVAEREDAPTVANAGA